jgi:hypothetical protein
MCHLAGLDLVLCSETIEPVSMSGACKLGTENQAKTRLLSKHATRESTQKDMSLHQFFFSTIEKSSLRKPVIPHYVGGKSYPTYPVTEGHTKSVLTCHVPWIGRSNFKANRNYIQKNFRIWSRPLLVPKPSKLHMAESKIVTYKKIKTQKPTSQIQTINYDTFSKIWTQR